MKNLQHYFLLRASVVLTSVVWIWSCCLAVAQPPELWWEPSIQGATAFETALGDVNGDGVPDAVQVHLLNEGYVLLNDGAGNFAQHPTASTLPTAVAVAMGDLNGNGFQDLLIGRSLSTCQVWTNNGSGEFFTTGQTIGPNTERRSVALADLNGDNNLDAVLPSGTATNPSEVWTNNGAGVFTYASTLGSNINRNVAVGDINGDTFPDVVFAANFSNTVWTNDGSGAFFDTGNVAGNESSYGIALGDLNGDTQVDAFIANGPNEPNEVWFNDGSGVFTNSGQALGGEYSFSVILVDVDEDNDFDAVVGNSSGQTNEVWLNNGVGGFSRSLVNLGLANALNVSAADLDGDADMDYFLTVNGNPSEVWLRVPLSQGGLLIDSGQRIGGYQLLDVVPGDFNDDGLLDIAYGALGQAAGLFTNNGFGVFSPTRQTLYQGVNIGAIERIDVNEDGFPDLLVGLDQSLDSPMNNRIWLNDGSGDFNTGPSFPISRATVSLAVADLDGNGLPDIVEGNRTTVPLPSENPTNRIYMNPGGGSLTSMDALGGGWTAALGVGDLNGDTLPDIVVGNKDIPSGVWTNTGTGQFIDTAFAFPDNVQDVVLADFNGSGALDIFFVASPNSTLYTNDGQGAFSLLPENFSTTAFFMRGEALDLDSDGHQDLWLGYGGSFSAALDRYYLNNGSNNFLGPYSVSSANLSRALAVGDFTGDGVTNVFSAGNRGDSQLWVWEIVLGPVESYASSFGLTGAELPPFADPEGDGVPNVMEYAFNMNPAVIDDTFVTNSLTVTQGLPFVTFTFTNPHPTLVAQAIQLINSSNITYHLDSGPATVFTGAVPASVNTTPLNATYERATYEYPVTNAPPNRVGRFRIQYTP